MRIVENGMIAGRKVIKYAKYTYNGSSDATEGRVYPVVEELRDDYRILDDADDVYLYDKDRFKDSTEEEYFAQLKYVKCIFKPFAEDNGLSMDKTYVVAKEDDVDYYIQTDDNDSEWFRKGYFEVVVKNPNATTTVEAVVEALVNEEPATYEELVIQAFRLLHTQKYEVLASTVDTKNTKAINALITEINTIEDALAVSE